MAALESRFQWHQVRGINDCIIVDVALGRSIYIIRSPHSYRPLADFVGLGRAEAIFIKKYIFLCSGQLIRIEERKTYY